MRYDGFEALTFDCYGTLIDWEAGMLRFLSDWCGNHGLRKSEEELLSVFSDLETKCQQEAPTSLYPAILERVLEGIGQGFGVPCSADEAAAFGASIGDWPPFPDSGEALAALQQRFRLVVVSNVDRTSFARSRRALGIEFDLVVTAEEVGAYKPDPQVFRSALQALRERGADPSRILHVAQSLYHDHVPAKAMGLKTVWINRRGSDGWGATPPPAAPVEPDAEFPDMRSFAEAALLAKEASWEHRKAEKGTP